MELYDVMRTTFACREFTGEAVPQDVLNRIIDHARFAPSGGNRQGWRIINIADPEKKVRLAHLSLPTATRYLLQMKKALLDIPPHWAVATIMPLGKPVKQLTKLKRKPVEGILYTDSWNGDSV